MGIAVLVTPGPRKQRVKVWGRDLAGSRSPLRWSDVGPGAPELSRLLLGLTFELPWSMSLGRLLGGALSGEREVEKGQPSPPW